MAFVARLSTFVDLYPVILRSRSTPVSCSRESEAIERERGNKTVENRDESEAEQSEVAERV